MSLLFVDILEITLPISALIGFLLLISPLIKKSYVAKWRYYMWLFIAIRLILPFKISGFDAPITMEIPKKIQDMRVVTAVSNTAQNVYPEVTIQSVMTMVWAIGVGIFILYQFICCLSFKHTVKRWAKPVENERITRFFEEIKEGIGEKRKLDIKICKIISTPMVVGVIRPVLLLPETDYTDKELRVILSHEMIHFRRNDILYKLILMVANAINWFNPLVYMMVGAANKDVELVCDAEVVKEHDMEFRRDYCRAILRVIHSRRSVTTPLSTCFIISKKVMKERFSDILDIKKKRRGIGLFILVSVSVGVSGSLVTFATERVADRVENELRIVERPTQKPTQTVTPKPVEPTQNEVSEVSIVTEKPYVPTSKPVERVYGNHTDSYTDNTENISYETVTEEPSQEPNVESENVVSDETETVTSTEQVNEIYEPTGEPDSVSSDGSKETYNLSDGNTVILQYDEEDELDTGYIIVE